jgi:hypothetical protein
MPCAFGDAARDGAKLGGRGTALPSPYGPGTLMPATGWPGLMNPSGRVAELRAAWSRPQLSQMERLTPDVKAG